MSYDEKRLALDALGVKVHVYRHGTVNEHGMLRPRWEMTMAVAEPSHGPVVNSSTRSN